MVSLRALFAALDRQFPFSRAESWDKTGLMVGDFDAPINRVLVTYEVTDAALDTAQQAECEAVVAYHPLIFKPLETLDFSDRTAHLCARLIRENRGLLCVHTALDGAAPPNALGDALARKLGIEGARVGKPSGVQNLVKIVVFVPMDKVGASCDVLWGAGAGAIGRYDEASFQSVGKGTFRPLEGATPRVGNIGERSVVPETRLEVVAPRDKWPSIVAAMKGEHPYEEVAYDVIPLENSESNQSYGPLRLAESKEKSLDFWIGRAKAALNPPSIRVAAPDDVAEFPFVACSPGSGAGFIPALPRGTVFISGDFKHHDALLAKHKGVALIDVTHAATEGAAIELMADALEKVAGVEVVRDETRNPFAGAFD